MPTATRRVQRARPKAEPTVTVEEVSTVEAGRRLGLTNQAIGQWCARSGAPVRRDGARVFVRWPDFPRWREEQLVEAAKPTALAERRLVAEARSAEIGMEMRELELAGRRGEVVAVADYEQALATVLDRLTARLRGLPPRLAHLGPAVDAKVEEEVERIVTELNQWDEDVVDEGVEDDDAETEHAA